MRRAAAYGSPHKRFLDFQQNTFHVLLECQPHSRGRAFAQAIAAVYPKFEQSERADSVSALTQRTFTWLERWFARPLTLPEKIGAAVAATATATALRYAV